MNKNGPSAGVVFLAAALAALLVVAVPVAAQTCSPLGLISCGPALSGSAPSRTCCDRLKQQRPCFCQYLKDPTLAQHFTPETAQRLATACGVTIPAESDCPP